MPRTLETVQATTRPGLVAVYSAADAVNGHQFLNTRQNVFLHVKNANAGTIVVTVVTPQTVDDLVLADRIVSVPTGDEVFIGPFSNLTYGNTPDGVYVDFNLAPGVTFAVLKLGAYS